MHHKGAYGYMFRLVISYNGKDTLGFTYKYIHPNNDNWYERECAVAIIVDIQGISDNVYDFNQETATNHTVLKTLHKNNKGIFYTQKNGKGYGSPTSRVYLDEKEVALMEWFLERAKKYHEDVIVDKE